MLAVSWVGGSTLGSQSRFLEASRMGRSGSGEEFVGHRGGAAKTSSFWLDFEAFWGIIRLKTAKKRPKLGVYSY